MSQHIMQQLSDEGIFCMSVHERTECRIVSSLKISTACGTWVILLKQSSTIHLAANMDKRPWSEMRFIYQGNIRFATDSLILQGSYPVVIPNYVIGHILKERSTFDRFLPLPFQQDHQMTDIKILFDSPSKSSTHACSRCLTSCCFTKAVPAPILTTTYAFVCGKALQNYGTNSSTCPVGI